ncbi:CAF1 family ribonuclease domain-containing protein [Theileria equi strain WA]|uniref:poly(A)-specific ribonuclease n=1 Tax=Theileria equi strain WA TaxID=1537102 RepID=L0B1E2_THEEQ|nr:CAF1 family ribonuclease domain-containing protein [Theileria equi strain WA]AFZ81323.1 CAF1 family ribonuclease domain-containing protein [Theileria equi strain WA]|eukprot:XP_004830989.1 CAF1 family ribonuclease domain-containing protein [Theileria equi strain WA]
MDEELQIVDVWADNLEDAFEKIRDVLELYPYVSIDTEFPGIVVRPTNYLEDYNYQTVKCNVDLLKIIQLGLTFADSDGSTPSNVSTWQFNFKFDLQHDMYAQDSIDLLKDSGIDFESHQKRGIELAHFGELIMSSGLVMNEDVIWISFHGSYDFAYLLKVLTCTNLPSSQSRFFELLHDFFPSLYDIKFLLDERSINLSGRLSLQKLAEHLDVERVGPQHQAGSDSLVTSRTFFKLMQRYFENKLDDEKYQGVIYGLGKSVPNLEMMKNTSDHFHSPNYNHNVHFTQPINSSVTGVKWSNNIQNNNINFYDSPFVKPKDTSILTDGMVLYDKNAFSHRIV